MKQVVACVPNFSEGCNVETINQISEAIKKVEKIKLLDVSSDKDHNRTVITFIGTPSAVKKAAFACIKKASELIDMSSHHGWHPRIGATDVAPVVPVKNVTIDDCIKISREVGKNVGDKLGIPVYLYGESAYTPERKSLQNIRKGEYEALPLKLQEEEWKPDYGPAIFNPKWGATVIGAREFVIAFNVNLKSRNIDAAKKIAMIIRESGSFEVSNNRRYKVPGVLKFVKAIGVNLKEYGLVQVSMNLTNYKETPIYMAFETVKRMSELIDIDVHSSEIVGLVPEQSLLMSGQFYSPRETIKTNLIDIAVEQIKLDKFEKFAAEKKIIEWMI